MYVENIKECGVALENYDLVTQHIIVKMFLKKSETDKKSVETGGIGYMAQSRILTELIDELGLLEEYKQFYYRTVNLL